MDNPADTSALTDRGHALPDEQSKTVAQTRLDEAWRALRREVKTLESSLATGYIDTDDVTDVVAAAALRVLRNPGGLTQAAGGIDDYRESATYSDPTQDIYFTAAELRRLSGPVAQGGSFAYTR